MKKIKFIPYPTNHNIGFSEDEILQINSFTKGQLPQAYLQFLKVAGKNSNVLLQSFKTMNELFLLQDDFKNKVQKSDIEQPIDNAWCFYQTNSDYYYFDKNEHDDPIVYHFSDLTYEKNNGWTVIHGRISKKCSFTEFITMKTYDHFDYPFWKKFAAIILLILSLPIILLIGIILLLHQLFQRCYKY